ncbi:MULTISPECIES: hypothetical protein [unclassified Streptomyces]|uniref:hypothetical protein n=1 Tax=unclassified Streptomyces TaxID=2593676 RepID=UPI003D914FF9
MTSRHVEADTTWSVPADPASEHARPADTTWSIPANAAAIEHAARSADTTW